MGRRTVLLLVALLIAALGTAMVLLYVKGIDDRATKGQQLVTVVVASDTIEANESADDAVAAGKFDTLEIPLTAKADGALASVSSLKGQVALGRILPGEQILGGKFADQFVVDPIQAGAGTSHNMNINEVMANRANEILGFGLGEKGKPVNPNDHVNMAQSTNEIGRASCRERV